MEISSVGPWVLLAVGSASCLAAVQATLRGRSGTGHWMSWVFGVLLAGVGVYGPLFLTPYGEFLKPILKMIDAPSQETYAAVFREVGQGQLPAQYQEMALAYALDRPVEGTDSLLERAIAGAPDPGGRAALTQTLRSYRQKEAVAERVAADVRRSGAPLTQLERLDPTTRMLVARRLAQLPDTALRRMLLDRRQLQTLTKPRPTRATLTKQ